MSTEVTLSEKIDLGVVRDNGKISILKFEKIFGPYMGREAVDGFMAFQRAGARVHGDQWGYKLIELGLEVEEGQL